MAVGHLYPCSSTVSLCENNIHRPIGHKNEQCIWMFKLKRMFRWNISSNWTIGIFPKMVVYSFKVNLYTMRLGALLQIERKKVLFLWKTKTWRWLNRSLPLTICVIKSVQLAWQPSVLWHASWLQLFTPRLVHKYNWSLPGANALFVSQSHWPFWTRPAIVVCAVLKKTLSTGPLKQERLSVARFIQKEREGRVCWRRCAVWFLWLPSSEGSSFMSSGRQRWFCAERILSLKRRPGLCVLRNLTRW